ncbi:MAG: alpha/beta fold hydrolase [Paracoccaceae bacterium]|nr:alpha/beta fold hydrolase [Paracoccaceae bacterium]
MNGRDDHEVFELGDVELVGGGCLRGARLAYMTYGALNETRDNVVLLPTFYTGTHLRNEGYFGPGRAIDPARHFVVSVNMFGNGLSTSPSNAHAGNRGAQFPEVALQDNVACQHRLLTERLGVRRIRLVAGWSMAGCQAYHWAVRFPDMVDTILPFCASARTSPHNQVFLDGVKSALTADPDWRSGTYEEPPVAGLRAFGVVYAGWAYSQTFFRDGLYRRLGFASPEALLEEWAREHSEDWDANDLLAMLGSWRLADISSGERFQGDFERALASIRARAILLPCAQDLYFPPEDNEIEARHMPNAELRVFESPWGHCVGSPGNDPEFDAFLDSCIRDLLDSG